MGNGIAESFNNWIKVERCMPPYAMLDQTRLKEMQQMADRRAEAEKWTTELTPAMETKLKLEMDKSRGFRLISSQRGVYEVLLLFTLIIRIFFFSVFLLGFCYFSVFIFDTLIMERHAPSGGAAARCNMCFRLSHQVFNDPH